jgi:diguanylate cyclase (GGDEF)-like protein/PAS domain S-box-containing protein
MLALHQRVRLSAWAACATLVLAAALQGWSPSGVLTLAALMAVLALGLVEPAVRAVRRRVQALETQAGVLQGQLLLAEHTQVLAQAPAKGQHKLQALWAALPAGVVVQAPSGEVVDANPAAERLLGLTLAQLQALRGFDPRWRCVREDGSDYPLAEQPAWRTLRSGQPLFNESMGVHTPEGELRWLLANTVPQFDAQGRPAGVITCFIDATDRRALQDRMHHASRTDALTRLPNREAVMERLARAIAHAQRHPAYGFAVLFMDFDRFKQVNDTLGHGAGDELLRQIALRLQQTLRPGDALARVDTARALAARLGGDEFVVVLEGVRDEATVQAITERLLADLREPYTVAHHPVQSSASIGVVLWRGQDLGPEEILRNADTAMYEAKRAGRNRCVIFDDSMHDRVVHALAIQADLRQALAGDELFLVYQPVVDLVTQNLLGVEALVRWKHPTRGLLMPGEFIAVAEECGLIDALGERVLQLACQQFVQWGQEQGVRAPLQMAVNLSRAQLKRPGLAAEVAALLAATGMPATQLQLEITESLAAQDERIQASLRELKSLGVKLALDDFGTGYSSLACLHLLPVDTVKIDRSFITHAETVEYHRVLIEATIRVARTLGMRTVAEGIETPGQAALMRHLCCDAGQGYLYGRPMAPSDLCAWLDRKTADLAVA